MLGFIIKFILYYKQYFVLDCKIGMHYIYIHRYTINYNKVREARLISSRFRFYLLIRYSLSFKWSSKSLFQNVSVTPAITLSQEDIFSSYKTFEGGNFICAVGNMRWLLADNLCCRGRDWAGRNERQDVALGGRFTMTVRDSHLVLSINTMRGYEGKLWVSRHSIHQLHD